MTKQRVILTVAGLVWVASLGVGFTRLLSYSTKPGPAAVAPAEWPRNSLIPASRGHYSLVMALHPHCPCSRASVAELNTLMARLQADNVKGYVLAVRPSDFPEEWMRTESYRGARRIPGVQVLEDPSGATSALFGAQTSGQVLLYNPAGRLMFAGGITPDRGHLGDSPGRQRILSLVKTGRADANQSLVFGCELGATICPLPQHAAPDSM